MARGTSEGLGSLPNEARKTVRVCPERQYLRPTQCGAGRGAPLNDEGIGQWRVRKPAAQTGNAEGAEEGEAERERSRK